MMLFAKENDTAKTSNLYDMQCMWWEIRTAMVSSVDGFSGAKRYLLILVSYTNLERITVWL